MNLSENLSNSLEYTKKLFKDFGRLIILIVLDIIPVVSWIVLGYAARVLRESPGSDNPPKLERYGELFVDGAKVFFASLIYMLIPVILIGIGAASLFASILTLGSGAVAPTRLLGGAGVVFLLVGIVLAIVLLVILGVGIAHMVKSGKFGKAFAFGEIFGIIGRIGWLRYLGWIVIVILASGFVLGVAGLIPYAGWLISAIISPALSVFIFRSLGVLYNDGAPAELRAQPSMSGGMACSSCGTTLQPHHKFCPNCGAPAPVPPTPSTPAPSVEGTRYCMSCGTKIPGSAKFCGACGMKQT